MTCKETQEFITALVDGELTGPERSAVEDHLKDCLSCQRSYRHENALKGAVRAAGLSLRAPASVREKILSGVYALPQTTESLKRWKELLEPPQLWLRPAFAVALLLILVLPTFYLLDQRSQSISLAAVETYGTFTRGDHPMIRAKSAEEIKEQLIRSAGESFDPMGYDLSTMNLEPVAGVVHTINGRKILVTVYQGQGSLICYTFLGTEDDAPDNAALFFDAEKKINFYSFSRGGINAVLHRERDIICILVSPMPMQDLLALARAKAHPG
jgi:anti-sigma factor RsiW